MGTKARTLLAPFSIKASAALHGSGCIYQVIDHDDIGAIDITNYRNGRNLVGFLLSLSQMTRSFPKTWRKILLF